MRALITGVTGFAGSHLAEYLLAHQPDVEVWGIYRWRSRMENLEGVRERSIPILENLIREARGQ